MPIIYTDIYLQYANLYISQNTTKHIAKMSLQFSQVLYKHNQMSLQFSQVLYEHNKNKNNTVESLA